MTYLELVNSVLRRMREATVATVTENDYSTLIGEYVNDAKAVVENAWTWGALRTTVQVTLVDATSGYTLTGAGKKSRTLQVFDDTNDRTLSLHPWAEMKRLLSNNSPSEGSPTLWSPNGTSGGDAAVSVYPVPTADEAGDLIDWYLFVPQADLTGTDELLVPDQPVLLLATAYALEDRGEDGGSSVARMEARAKVALDEAINADSVDYEDELTWEVE